MGAQPCPFGSQHCTFECKAAPPTRSCALAHTHLEAEVKDVARDGDDDQRNDSACAHKRGSRSGPPRPQVWLIIRELLHVGVRSWRPCVSVSVFPVCVGQQAQRGLHSGLKAPAARTFWWAVASAVHTRCSPRSS